MVSKVKGVLAASTAAVFCTTGGFATAVFAQVEGGPVAGSGPTPVGQAPATAAPTDIGVNFRRDTVITVSQRPREGYEALGIRAGTFLVFPKVTVGVDRTDNVFASRVNEADDTIWRIQPEVAVNSDWNRHQLAAYARANVTRHQDFPHEDAAEWALGASGRLDVTRATQVNSYLNFNHAVEPRTSPNAQALPPGTDPVEYDLTGFGVQGRHEFNRLLLTGRYENQDFQYDSPRNAQGVIISQAYRDRKVHTFGARADYAISPATAVFGELIYNKRDAHKPAAGAVNRDSTGYQAHVGVNFELTNLIRGDIGVGYLHQDFDAASQKDLEGFSTRASLDWLPTQLTTVSLTADRSVQDSAIPGAVGYISTNLGVRVDHELLRNVILTARAGYGKDEYTGVIREDQRTTAAIGANYLINRNLGVSATYSYNKLEPKKGAGFPFEENRLSAALTVQY